VHRTIGPHFLNFQAFYRRTLTSPIVHYHHPPSLGVRGSMMPVPTSPLALKTSHRNHRTHHTTSAMPISQTASLELTGTLGTQCPHMNPTSILRKVFDQTFIIRLSVEGWELPPDAWDCRAWAYWGCGEMDWKDWLGRTDNTLGLGRVGILWVFSAAMVT